jgi:hypothetical protein
MAVIRMADECRCDGLQQCTTKQWVGYQENVGEQRRGGFIYASGHVANGRQSVGQCRDGHDRDLKSVCKELFSCLFRVFSRFFQNEKMFHWDTVVVFVHNQK